MTIDGRDTRESPSESPPPAPPPPQWESPAPAAPPSTASRSVLLILLFILICGQAFWVFRRLNPGSPFAFNSAGGSGPAAAPAAGSATPAASTPAAAAPTRSEAPGPIPKNPRLGTDDICLALGGADARAVLDLSAPRRLKLVDVLRKMAIAEDQRWNAVEQMRSAFTEEQAREIPSLIQQPPFATLEGDALRDEATRVLTKDANGATAPTTASTPAPSANVLDWDQSLRGAMALDKTPNMLSASQAAQIAAAIPVEQRAAANGNKWLGELNTILHPDEKQKVYKYHQALQNREKAVLDRTHGATTTARLLQYAITALESQGQ